MATADALAPTSALANTWSLSRARVRSAPGEAAISAMVSTRVEPSSRRTSWRASAS